jgi:hypothetical protein
MIKHFLNFVNDGFGRHEIPEPINFSGTDFTLKQDDGRLGRDTSFSGGESSFIFTKFAHAEYFDKIQEYYDVYGNESVILYETEISNTVEVHGKFDFQTAKNNVYDKIEVSIIQEQTSELIKKREDISVNLFGNKTLDDVNITPCQTSNILLISKPLLQNSELDMGNSDILVQTERAFGVGSSAGKYSFVMPILQPKKSAIKDTLLGAIQAVPTTDGLEALKILNATETLKDLKLDFEWDFDLKTVISGIVVSGYTKFQLRVSYGSDATGFVNTVIQSGQVNEDITSNRTGTFNVNIPLLTRGSGVWLFLYVETIKSSIGGTWIRSDFTFKKWNVKLEAVSKSVNTLVKGVRLHEAINYTSQSLAGIPTDFNYGETTLQDHFIFNGNLLRNIQDRPFYLKWQDVHNWMKLINADFELTPTNECFIGLESEYYTNTEMFVFDEIQNEEYNKMFNRKFLINKFQLEFENYQAKNENTDTNTNDTIHGQATFYTASKGVENKKEIKIPISYDPFLAEQKKREQVTKDDTTATKDDDSLFIFDCVPYVNQSFNETFLVKHTVDAGKLKVINDGSFSWITLGLAQLDRVDIIAGHNLGGFTSDIANSTDRTLVLIPNIGVTISNINEALTTFIYFPTDFDYQIRTMEGIDVLSGFDNPLDFGNVLWGAGRVTKQFYNSYLATANLYNDGKAIKNSSYTKNGNAIIDANGLAIKESEAFTPTNPILNQFIHTITVNCSFANFLILKNKVKTERGYIRVFDADGFPIKLYPKELVFLNNSDNLKNSKLTIVGEEKYQTNTINIVYANDGFLFINGEVIITKLKYDEKRNKIYIFDDSNRLLFRPVFWQKVAINGANATTLDELKSWLTQLE